MKGGTPHYGRGGSRATEFCIRWQQKPVYRPWATLLFSKKHRSSRCRSSTLKNCEAKTMALRDSIRTFTQERKQKTNDEWFQLTLIFTTTLLDVTAAAAIAADGNSTLSTNEVGAVFDVNSTFRNSCSGCHVKGGNILAAGKTLSVVDLERNLDSVSIENISRIISQGKNQMPGYGETCTPRGQCTFGKRLNEKEIEYVVLSH